MAGDKLRRLFVVYIAIILAAACQPGGHGKNADSDDGRAAGDAADTPKTDGGTPQTCVPTSKQACNSGNGQEKTVDSATEALCLALAKASLLSVSAAEVERRSAVTTQTGALQLTYTINATADATRSVICYLKP